MMQVTVNPKTEGQHMVDDVATTGGARAKAWCIRIHAEASLSHDVASVMYLSRPSASPANPPTERPSSRQHWPGRRLAPAGAPEVVPGTARLHMPVHKAF